MRLSLLTFAAVLAIAGYAQANSLQSTAIEGVDSGIAAAGSKASLVERRSFPSALLNDDVTYHLYIPPSYAADTENRFPVVYWLHGSGGYPPGVLDTLASRFHGAMQTGRMPPAIIVFPDGFEGTLWANAASGKRPVEDMLVKELVPHIDAEFRTRATASGRLIEGASMGGYGAARLGMLYPDIFGAVSMINPGPMQPVLDPENAPLAGRARATETLESVFGGDVKDFKRRSPWMIAQRFANRACANVRMRMILGEKDPIAPTNLKFSQHLDRLGISHKVEMIADAGHNPRAMLANLGNRYWDFFADAFAGSPRQAQACQ